ncbi:MAG: DUF1289 domain-containing protein [Hyphomicrobiales bacterium]|nr:DUF1289 domain-containing protein [Alphaproteobacteria bacterium]
MRTPCKNICSIDEPTGLCIGCGRSVDEIGRWISYSHTERARIMADLPKRLDALNARAPAAKA